MHRVFEAKPTLLSSQLQNAVVVELGSGTGQATLESLHIEAGSGRNHGIQVIAPHARKGEILSFASSTLTLGLYLDTDILDQLDATAHILVAPWQQSEDMLDELPSMPSLIKGHYGSLESTGEIDIVMSGSAGHPARRAIEDISAEAVKSNAEVVWYSARHNTPFGGMYLFRSGPEAQAHAQETEDRAGNLYIPLDEGLPNTGGTSSGENASLVRVSVDSPCATGRRGPRSHTLRHP